MRGRPITHAKGANPSHTSLNPLKRFIVYSFAIALLATISSTTRAAEIRANIQMGAGGFTASEVGVIEAAIEWWEAIIKDDIVFDVQFRKRALAGSTRGSTHCFTEDGGGTPTSAIIDLDSTGGPTGFFVDETPHQNEEFQAGSTPFHMTARSGSGAEDHGDMLSIVKHELCHALGFTRSYTRFNALICDPGGGMNRTFKAPDCNATLVPRARGTHLDNDDHPFDAMNTSVGCGQRRLTSDLDKKLLEAAFDFDTNCPEAAATVPFMSRSLLLLLALLLAAGAWRTLGRAQFKTAAALSIFVVISTIAFLHCSEAQQNQPQPGQRAAFLANVPDDASSAVVMQEVTTFSEIDRQEISFWTKGNQLFWKHSVLWLNGSRATPKEGSSSSATALADYDALWTRLQNIDVWSLGDDRPAGGIEDASTFRFGFLKDNRSHSFVAEGIDVLEERRYRQLYDEVMAFLGQVAE